KLRVHLQVEDGELIIQNELDHPIRSDVTCLEIILINLLENALLYGRKIPDKMEVKISVSEFDGGVELSVCDYGMGIEADVQPYILEPFFKGTDRSRGNGLGLFLVQKATEKLEGQLSFKSVPNEYTLFSVKLPHLVD
ncbi:MAG: sensor histidine kinase, partial [Flammeovirgaceae bacterium]